MSSNSITDNPPFGKTNITITEPGTESQDDLTWNNTTKKWEGSLFDIAITVGSTSYTAAVNYAGTTTLLAAGEYGSSTSIDNGTNIMFVEFVDSNGDLWIMESGATGDPHIKPLFGKDYTI